MSLVLDKWLINWKRGVFGSIRISRLRRMFRLGDISTAVLGWIGERSVLRDGVILRLTG
jgi:hypothetical protein